MANPDTITIGAATYDVYGPRADADAYFGGKFGRDSWADAGGTDKDRALVSATRLLELQRYKGSITDDTTPQSLLWPRTGITDRRGVEVPDTDFPQDVLYAYYELAQAIIDDPELANIGNQDDNTKRAKAGDVEVEFFTPTKNQPRFPNQVQEYLKPYLAGSGLALGYGSGCSSESSFESGQFSRSEGFA